MVSIFQTFCIGNSVSERAQTQFLLLHAAVGSDVGFLQELFTEVQDCPCACASFLKTAMESQRLLKYILKEWVGQKRLSVYTYLHLQATFWAFALEFYSWTSHI